MIKHQGGDASVIEDYGRLPVAKETVEIKSPTSGYVRKIHTERIGIAGMTLGVGRVTKEDGIDPSVGIRILKHVGDRVEAGDVIAVAYVNGKGADTVERDVVNAYTFTSEPCERNGVVLDRVE